MTRTKVLIVVILVVILGFLLGWWLSGRIAPVPQSPVSAGASSSSHPHITDGFCCMNPGQSCISVKTPSSCFSQHGKGFNSRQATCDHFCITIGSIKK